MKLHQIAFAAAAALVGSQASALSITDTNAAGTVKVYASGASAVSNVLAGIFVQNCASNLDIYQVNCSFHDALGGNDLHYLVARAIQFFMPGVPQVYYVGLLAGANDLALLAASGVGRDINRHRYSHAEIETELQRPVVQRLLALIRLRNAHPAFGGHFSLGASDARTLVMCWHSGAHRAELHVDLAAPADHRLAYTDEGFAEHELPLV